MALRSFVGLTISAILALNAWALEQPTLPSDKQRVRELRLGVVCYGGVSLAIYMYGMTREIHHLALASTALECDAGEVASCGPVPSGSAWTTLPTTARPYYVALVDQWRANNVRTRVVVDIISGTSAGGINGIVLAKALAHNSPLVGLRRIWFDEAEIKRLAGRPWSLRAAWRLLRNKPALYGDTWLKQLYVALNEMDVKSAHTASFPSLIPPAQELDLLVTATDFYGTERELEIGDPARTWEKRHDLVMRFWMRRGADNEILATDFGRTGNQALAFAARASASFPVAFPAVRLADLGGALGEAVDEVSLARKLFSDRLPVQATAEEASALAENLYLVDGGVLDNYPFSIASRRVSRRARVLETERRFIYLEPDPRIPPDFTIALANEEPRAMQMFWRAQAAIPGAEPIAQDLLEIAQHNERVARIADIVRRDEMLALSETTSPTYGGGSIASRVERTLGLDTGRPSLGSESLQRKVAEEVSKGSARSEKQRDPVQRQRDAISEFRDKLERDASSGIAVMEEAYMRLRVHSVLDQMSRNIAVAMCGLPEDFQGPHASLSREVVFQWASRNGLTRASTPAERLRRQKFLAAYDLGYLRRRLRFVSEWLNAQYDPKHYNVHDYGLSRDQVRDARSAIARQVEAISAVLRGNRLARLGPQLQRAESVLCVAVKETAATQARRILDDPIGGRAIADFVAAVEEELLGFQEDVLTELHDDFVAQTRAWNDPAARAVLARYLGFPYWDRASYPYTAFSGGGELARVEIMRFSPTDTNVVTSLGAAKLSGSRLAHFGAFFDAEGRQRDYLWGRFDAAERLFDLLRVSGDDAEVRTVSLIQDILKEEEAEGVVKQPIRAFMRACVEKRGTCSVGDAHADRAATKHIR